MTINGLNAAYNGIDIANVNKVTADILSSLENKREIGRASCRERV